MIENMTSLPEAEPIIVYSMRKVGSTTLTSTLLTAGYKVYKHHCLSSILNKQLQQSAASSSIKTQHWLTDGAAFSRRLNKWRRERANSRSNNRLKIFTFVKDPISIALSDYFMHLYEFMPQVLKAKRIQNIKDLKAYFEFVLHSAIANDSTDPVTAFLGRICLFPTLWFQQELKTTMAVDILNMPFDINKGYSLYHGEDCDIALIRTDKLSQVTLDAIYDLIKYRPGCIVEQNVRSKMANGELYSALVDSIRLPLNIVEEYFLRASIAHFYTKDEIELMLDKWCGRK